MIAIDRGYNDYARDNPLTALGLFFVTRLNSNAKSRAIHHLSVLADKRLTNDQTIEFTGIHAAKQCPIQLRRIGYRNSGTGRSYVFLTNNFNLAAKTIAAIYQTRWQVELFFKSIKQNLKIKSFIGTGKYAVLTQVWIALCGYLLLAFIELKKSIQRLLQPDPFEK